MISGPVGIGKTRLLRELLAPTASRNRTVLSASGSDWESALPLAGYTQLMGSAPVRSPSGFDGGPQPPSQVVERLTPDQALNYAQTLQTHLEAQQHRGPVTVVIDDLQWLDEDSLRILIFAARRLHSCRVLFLFAVDLDQADGANALVPAAEQTGSDGLSDLRRQGPDALHVGSEAVQLTAQEQAVAQFVAGGSTNKEVAQALFIAEKTAQFHLTRIYAKFGVRSRSELAAVYAREGMGSTGG